MHSTFMINTSYQLQNFSLTKRLKLLAAALQAIHYASTCALKRSGNAYIL